MNWQQQPSGQRGPEVAVRATSLAYAGRNGPVHALQECSLTVPGGAFACLVGPSGCGKSTLLDLVAGLSQGAIEIGPGAFGRKARLAVVFQRPALFPWKTVAGNIAFGLRAQGIERTEARRRTAEFIGLVGLEGFAKAYPP